MNNKSILHPYLGLTARRSLIWTNHLTLPLILTAFALVLALSSIDAGVDEAKRELTTACRATEQAASVAASLPHFAAQGVNELTASSAEGLVHGLAKVLDLALVALEALINFIIQSYQARALFSPLIYQM